MIWKLIWKKDYGFHRYQKCERRKRIYRLRIIYSFTTNSIRFSQTSNICRKNKSNNTNWYDPWSDDPKENYTLKCTLFLLNKSFIENVLFFLFMTNVSDTFLRRGSVVKISLVIYWCHLFIGTVNKRKDSIWVWKYNFNLVFVTYFDKYKQNQSRRQIP